MTSRSSSSKGLVRDGVRRSLWAVVLSTLTILYVACCCRCSHGRRSTACRHITAGIMVSPSAAARSRSSWQLAMWSLSSVADRLGGENVLVKLAVIMCSRSPGRRGACSPTCTTAARWTFYHSLPDIAREAVSRSTTRPARSACSYPTSLCRALTHGLRTRNGLRCGARTENAASALSSVRHDLSSCCCLR